MRIKTMAVSALFAALICILAPISVPIGPIPVSLGVFAVAFGAVVLGWKLGAAATALYLLIGAVGVPVFTGYNAGPAVFLGVTGGYIWSYIFMAILIGAASDAKKKRPAALVCGMLAAMILCHILGTLQFMLVAKQSFLYALSVCSIPFIPFDIAKLIAAGVLGTAVRNALVKAKLL